MISRTWIVALALVVVVPSPGSAEKAGKNADKPGGKVVKPIAVDTYDELFERYLAAARKQPVTLAPDASSWMNSLMVDTRARRLNDLVTVRVIESITATGTADSSVNKASGASVGVPSLFGLEGKLPALIDPANMVSAKASTTFKGGGTTTRAGDLTAVITARVAEVLPNGDLVVEGVREIEINGDRQIVILTGVARVADIAPGNVVLSSALGQLRIRYFGRGLIKDSLSPGWLIRVLNKIF
jgi:flagellar L-ring protein precursor FlgH